jgi:hypothetical protein
MAHRNSIKLFFERFLGYHYSAAFLVALVAAIPCQAAPYQEILGDGSEYTLSFDATSSRTEPVSVFFVSPGAVSLAVEVGLEGPPGLAGTLQTSILRGPAGTAISQMDDPKFPWESTKLIAAGAKGRREYDSFMVDPATAGGMISFLYHLHKDACLGTQSVRYVSRLVFNVSSVPESFFAQGFTIRVAMREYRFPGSQAASIKPASEGKYRGEPILLMSSVQYGSEYVNIIQRSKGKVVARRRIPIVKYVSHRGQSLSLARLRGMLRGGKATFELSNGGAIYGVCFDLTRRRQFANGYKL